MEVGAQPVPALPDVAADEAVVFNSAASRRPTASRLFTLSEVEAVLGAGEADGVVLSAGLVVCVRGESQTETEAWLDAFRGFKEPPHDIPWDSGLCLLVQPAESTGPEC